MCCNKSNQPPRWSFIKVAALALLSCLQSLQLPVLLVCIAIASVKCMPCNCCYQMPIFQLLLLGIYFCNVHIATTCRY